MALIQLAYKRVIDASATGNFEQKVFKATYEEFLIKSKAYNPGNKIKTFSALKAHDGGANSLHYKISLATGHYIDTLTHKIPSLTDNIDNPVLFDVARFELLESDIFDMSKHKIAIEFITQPLTLCSTMGEYMLLAYGPINTIEPAQTFVLKMQPDLSILNYQLQETDLHNTPNVSRHY